MNRTRLVLAEESSVFRIVDLCDHWRRSGLGTFRSIPRTHHRNNDVNPERCHPGFRQCSSSARCCRLSVLSPYRCCKGTRTLRKSTWPKRPDTLPLDETSLREARSRIATARSRGKLRGRVFLADLVERAARDIVTEYDVALAGFGNTTRSGFAASSRCSTCRSSLSHAIVDRRRAGEALDPPPPVRESGLPMLRVSHSERDRSRGRTLCAGVPQWRFLGTERPAAPVGRHVPVVIRERAESVSHEIR
ncbi:MAG: hypothetical protein JWM87_1345 [Candidatus Eremiobacteraeota bacterium]|nr:hypothetical protein [Candidatus Eremiobacteraeota bacterium]